MNKKFIKQIAILFAMMVGAITLFSTVPTAFAQLADTGAQDLGLGTGGETSLTALIVKMVNYFLTFLGLIAVIMIIYGGVTYITAAGKDEAIGNAKKIIMYAIIGLIIVALSFVVVRAVIGAGGATPV